MTLGTTIVAGNTAATNGPDVFGNFTSQGHNLIGKTNGSSGWVGTDLTGTIAQPLNAMLAPLGNYGGPTETMALLPGSPAIGAGRRRQRHHHRPARPDPAAPARATSATSRPASGGRQSNGDSPSPPLRS